jgi:hypothetical protein
MSMKTESYGFINGGIESIQLQQKSVSTTKDNKVDPHIKIQALSQNLDHLPQLNDEINDFEIPISSKPYADLIDSSNREAI